MQLQGETTNAENAIKKFHLEGVGRKLMGLGEGFKRKCHFCHCFSSGKIMSMFLVLMGRTHQELASKVQVEQ